MGSRRVPQAQCPTCKGNGVVTKDGGKPITKGDGMKQAWKTCPNPKCKGSGTIDAT